MRILVFHGYLLSGTGSNVYNARLAEAFVRLGHEVHLFSQDRHPKRQGFVDAIGDWDEGALRVRTLHEPVRCTVYRPNIGPLLPVYVADRYEGIRHAPSSRRAMRRSRATCGRTSRPCARYARSRSRRSRTRTTS